MLSQILGSSWVGLDPWVKEKNMGQYWVGKIPTQPGGSRVGLNPFGALLCTQFFDANLGSIDLHGISIAL